MKLAFKHKMVLPDVERVLRDAARADATFLRFPRPIDEIMTLCYPLAIEEIAGLDTRKAHAEMAKLGGACREEIGDNHKLAGFLFARSDGGVVLVEGVGTSEARKRFTKAHELGHFILQVLPKREELAATPDLFAAPEATRRFFRAECTADDLTRIGPTSREQWLTEVRANHFAAELLMPADEIRNQLRQFREPPTCNLVVAMSRYFDVSRAAMEVRLADLQAIPAGSSQGNLC